MCMKTLRSSSSPSIVLHDPESRSLTLLEAIEIDISCSPPAYLTENKTVLSYGEPRDTSKLRACLKEEQRLREALKKKGIVMEEVEECVFGKEQTCIVLDTDLRINDLAFDSTIFVSLAVSTAEEGGGDAQWSDIVIRGSPFGVRYKSKEVETIKIQYAWATHFLFKGGLFIESSPYSEAVSEILLRRTLTILREFCGFPTIQHCGRRCYSSVVSGTVNHSLNLTLLISLFPDVAQAYSDHPGLIALIRYDDLVPTRPSSLSLKADPMDECLRCGLLIRSIEEFELFLVREPIVLFLLQEDGTISCQGAQSNEQMHHCYASLSPFLSICTKQ
jgi:hypothetical protein